LYPIFSVSFQMLSFVQPGEFWKFRRIIPSSFWLALFSPPNPHATAPLRFRFSSFKTHSYPPSVDILCRKDWLLTPSFRLHYPTCMPALFFVGACLANYARQLPLDSFVSFFPPYILSGKKDFPALLLSLLSTQTDRNFFTRISTYGRLPPFPPLPFLAPTGEARDDNGFELVLWPRFAPGLSQPQSILKFVLIFSVSFPAVFSPSGQASTLREDRPIRVLQSLFPPLPLSRSPHARFVFLDFLHSR